MEPEPSTSEQHPSLFQIISEEWMAVNLQKDPTTLPEKQRGAAKWTNMHNENLYTFYVKVEDLYYTVEFINKAWYQLTYNENLHQFFTKQDQSLVRTDSMHPFHSGKGVDTTSITEQLNTTPVFKDIAEDNQLSQPRGDYMPATMPTTFPLKPSRFGNPVFFPRTPWPAQPAQSAAKALAGLNPEVLEYLVHAMN